MLAPGDPESQPRGTSARAFIVHHTQRISVAAKLGDANAIWKSVNSRRQQMLKSGRGHAVVGA